MSTENSNTDLDKGTSQTNPVRQALLDQCELLGIPYQANTATSKLQELVAARVNEAATKVSAPIALIEPSAEELERAKRTAAYESAMKLVRVIVVCLNPAKSDVEGELFTYGNSLVPTESKYVPFGRESGWHIPRILVEMLREKKYQGYRSFRDSQGNNRKKVMQLPAYSVTELPALSVEELKEMKSTFVDQED